MRLSLKVKNRHYSLSFKISFKGIRFSYQTRLVTDTCILRDMLITAAKFLYTAANFVTIE